MKAVVQPMRRQRPGRVSPRAKVRARQRGMLAAARHSYRGAESDRFMADWMPGAGTADEDLIPDLATLRERSRDLNRNDPFASALTRAAVDVVVGTGFQAQCRLDPERLGITEDQAREFESAAERSWQRWEETGDITGRQHFREQQAVLFRSSWENGDVFANLPMLPESVIAAEGRPYSLAVELVEADRVSSPPEEALSDRVRDGVVLGNRGQPIAYYVQKTGHPGERFFRKLEDFKRVRRVNGAGRMQVVHYANIERPGQTRGTPMFASSLSVFDDLFQWIEAELVAKRMEAANSMSIKVANPVAAMQARSHRFDNDPFGGRQIAGFEPGGQNWLFKDDEIVFHDPKRPGGGFDEFARRILRAIGSSVGFPYELMTKDYSQTNFHSGRAALLDLWRMVRRLQVSFTNQVLRPIWRLLLEEAWMRGDVPDVPFDDDPREWSRVEFVPAQGMMLVEPDKELKGIEKALDLKLTTRSEEAAKFGRSHEDIVRQQVREELFERKVREEAGLSTPPAAGGDEEADGQEQDGQPEEQEEEEEVMS